MRFFGISTLVLVILTTTSSLKAHASTPTHAWSHGFGDTQLQQGHSVATDADGNVIVAGAFQQTMDLGGSALTSAGNSDIFVAKFSANGTHQWSHSFGDLEPQTHAAVAVDQDGNVIVGGWFRGTINFGGSNLVSSGGFDAFLAKFDANGVHQWSRHFGDASDQFPWSVATDVSGSAILTGRFSGTVNFGGANLTSAGGEDIFLAKLDASGVHQWSQRFGTLGSQRANSVATDGYENVILTGFFISSVDFGGGPIVMTGGTFLAKFNSAGVHQWSHGFAGGEARAVATDGTDHIYMTGDFPGTMNFGGGNLATAGMRDVFVAKFDPAGIHVWSKRFGDHHEQENSAVATDPQGNVILTGRFIGELDFGGGILSSAGDHEQLPHDIYVAKLSSSGGYHQWSERFGDTQDQVPRSVATSPDGGLIVTGGYDGTLDFGGSTLYPFDGDFYFDLFLVRFAEPVTSVPRSISRDHLSLLATPNPFNPATTIRYAVPSNGHVTLAIYDARGVRVATLVDEPKLAGEYTVPWLGRNAAGDGVSSGVYFARITHASGTKSYKMVLLK